MPVDIFILYSYTTLVDPCPGVDAWRVDTAEILEQGATISEAAWLTKPICTGHVQFLT